MTAPLILALDQGTTSSRALVFDATGAVVASAQREFPQIYPREGWVEHDPEAIWGSVVAVGREALAVAETRGGRVAAIGVANQRETTLVWDRATGRPIHNAIVWQDRRTADRCRALEAAGALPQVRETTGLVLDPYFSATKAGWLLDAVDGARVRAGRGELAFGTVDSFLVWRLTAGRVHATDATNASRTSLYDLRRGDWSDELCRLFDVPRALLPPVGDSAAEFGSTEPGLFGRPLPILGLIGDQQAAALGHGALAPGCAKCTFGTGGFLLASTGETPVASAHRLLTTVAVQLGGRRRYALEGSIFSAGAAVQWLRDGLGVIATAGESEALAAALPDSGGVHLVPAFTGLGAPWWDAEARGAILGLTRATTAAHLARAALESVAFQTVDLLSAMAQDGAPVSLLRVDGGFAANSWAMQALADLSGLTVERPASLEVTAWGAALLAGSRAGVYGDLGPELVRGDRFTPRLPADARERRLAGWRRAVERTLA